MRTSWTSRRRSGREHGGAREGTATAEDDGPSHMDLLCRHILAHLTCPRLEQEAGPRRRELDSARRRVAEDPVVGEDVGVRPQRISATRA